MIFQSNTLAGRMEELNEMTNLFAVTAIYSVYGYIQSLRYGTPEMVVGYQLAAGRFGVASAMCAFVYKQIDAL